MYPKGDIWPRPRNPRNPTAGGVILNFSLPPQDHYSPKSHVLPPARPSECVAEGGGACAGSLPRAGLEREEL